MDRNTQTGSRGARPGNVIPLRQDAAFFFERGVRYLERNDLRRALKAFRRTVEVEPDNPVNYCNLAGVLSELGDFEASNEVLLHVLQNLDPSMAECQFYLANNYANMGDYETAEEYVLRYLDADPDGEYAQEAVEMLDILMDEFGGGKAYARWQAEQRRKERASAKRDGRHLLEEGQFEAAVEWLERVTQQDPGNTAALNNLSLAYYYTGQYDQAVALAERVLAEHPKNVHALCNLTVFCAHLGPRDQYEACVAKLRKLFPMHYDHAAKVGTTLGLVGDHRAAYEVFAKLVKLAGDPDPAMIHALAAAAANCGQYGVARRWWRVLSQRSGMAEVAEHYLKALDRAERSGQRFMRVSYQYELPIEAQFAKMKARLESGDLAAWRQDPLLRASLYWGLRHGAAETQRAVIRILAIIADQDAEKALRAYLRRQDIAPPQQAAALHALQRMGARGRVELWRDGEWVSLRMSEVPKDVILAVDPVWRQVLERVTEWLRNHRKARYVAEARRVWVGYLRHAFQRTDRAVGKPEVWMAALLYAVLKRHNEPVRQKDVAQWFHVSVSALSKAAGKLSCYFVTMP
ncbi:tetratricopeptide repeat protein [Alicyclobacillus macrosporangiidus]|uniref:Tfp pilus assembly protein PilF n=1 Tax=Alicyclobacillus macrosporangiidus TaxID=392015 RepID=A0A1I7K1J1_9BACL|nr:tetratricopeptide repeat protein [Alicyclobacillus macrosporangiidus]SFU91316.1 Tfp pilus assembly protein PilF [Alicyclobacillus macrosporangiidus]